MVKYSYDVEEECFKRNNTRGRPLYVNIIEAQRITHLVDLGAYTENIVEKVKLSNPKAGKSTVRTFIKNYKEDNVEMPSDAPVPARVFDEMKEESRVNALEKRVETLENIVGTLLDEPKSEGIIERIRTWI